MCFVYVIMVYCKKLNSIDIITSLRCLWNCSIANKNIHGIKFWFSILITYKIHCGPSLFVDLQLWPLFPDTLVLFVSGSWVCILVRSNQEVGEVQGASRCGTAGAWTMGLWNGCFYRIGSHRLQLTSLISLSRKYVPFTVQEEPGLNEFK